MTKKIMEIQDNSKDQDLKSLDPKYFKINEKQMFKIN